MLVPRPGQELVDIGQLHRLQLLIYQMEDNRLLMPFAPKVHWTLSSCIVQYSMDFFLRSVAHVVHGLALGVGDGGA